MFRKPNEISSRCWEECLARWEEGKLINNVVSAGPDEIIRSPQQGDIFARPCTSGPPRRTELQDSTLQRLRSLFFSPTITGLRWRCCGGEAVGGNTTVKSRNLEVGDKQTPRISVVSRSRSYRLNIEIARLNTSLHTFLPPSLSLSPLSSLPLLVRGERLGTSFAFINITLADRVIFRNQAAGECHL